MLLFDLAQLRSQRQMIAGRQATPHGGRLPQNKATASNGDSTGRDTKGLSVDHVTLVTQ